MVHKMIGVLSDTHGLLRQEVKQALSGVDIIFHAGDVGHPDVLEELQKIAPVVAVRGNMDMGEWAKKYPLREMVEFGGRWVYMLHDLNQMDLDPQAAGLNIVISGHSHRPLEKIVDGILYLNPGSVGPRRFNLPISLAKIYLEEEQIRSEFIHLG